MVSPFVSSSFNNIVPRSLKNYRKKKVINKLERSTRDSNSKLVDSLYNSNFDTPQCASIILKPALDINTILNTNVDNNSNKKIEKVELKYITNNKDPTEITTNEVSSSGLFNNETIISQNKTNNTKIAKSSSFFISQFANSPSKKNDSSATIRDLHLKTDLENEKDSIERGKCTSVESLPTKSFERNIQRSRQDFNPSRTKVN